MKVEYQSNDYECGICVLTSIYNYLFDDKITKNELLEKYNITNIGTSIHDLEVYSKELGISIESYKISYDEFCKLTFDEYFITTISNEESDIYHFVIAKKTNNGIKIFDSINGKYLISFEDFEHIFSGYFLIFSKINDFSNKPEFIFENINLFKNRNEWTFIFICIFFNLIVLFFSYLSASYLKIFISSINDTIPQNLIFISIFFILIFICNYLFNKIFDLIKLKKMNELLKDNFVFFINHLENKTSLFFINTPKNKIYEYPMDLFKVMIYKYIRKPEMIADLFFVNVLIIVLLSKSIYFFVFSIIYSLISIFFIFLSKKYNERKYNDNVYSKNGLEISLHNLYHFIENEKNFFKLNQTMNNVKNNFFKVMEINNSNFIYHKTNNQLSNFIKKVALLIFISTTIFLFLNGEKKQITSLAELMFFVSILNLFEISLSSVIEYFLDYKNIEFSKQNLDNFYRNYNKKNFNGKETLLEIKEIEFNNLCFEFSKTNIFENNKNLIIKNNSIINGENGAGKTTLLKIIAFLLEPSEETCYFINGISIENYDNKLLNNKICYLPSKSTSFDANVSKIISMNDHIKNEISLFIKMNKLFPIKNTNLSLGQIQLLNLFSLLSLRNNIILLDESFSNLSKKNIEFFMENFFPTIQKNNFVIAVSHNENVKKYFKNEVNL